MAPLKNILPPKLFEVVERAGLSTSKQILLLSIWDIKKRTNLRTDDIILLKNLVADHTSPESLTCNKLALQDDKKITAGCEAIDKLLNGGFRKGTITEIFGESGSGKTQVAIQAAAHNWSQGCVYICTEDLFPVKRFEQIKRGIPCYNPNNDYGKNVFVEHITEAQDLLNCVRVRLPKLLQCNKLSIIIIDSVAAPFRSEYTNYVQRAKELRELAVLLIQLAQEYNLAVVCINQVTAAFDGTEDVLPSLGLAWSNMISTRLMLKKTEETNAMYSISSSSRSKVQCESYIVRELSVVFAPDLPNSVTKFIITSTGIQAYS